MGERCFLLEPGQRHQGHSSYKIAIGGSKIWNNFTPSVGDEIYTASADTGQRCTHRVQHFLSLLRKSQKGSEVQGR
jgi:hypothetical protein